MSTIQSNPEVIIGRRLVEEIEQTHPDRQSGSVLAELSDLVGSEEVGARMFVATFKVVVGEAQEQDSFAWRMELATQPETIFKLCSSIRQQPMEPRWIPSYSKGLVKQLGEFTTNHPESTSEAVSKWGELMLDLLKSDEIHDGVRGSIQRFSLEALNKTIHYKRDAGAISAREAKRALVEGLKSN